MKRSGTDCSEFNLKRKNVNALENYKTSDANLLFADFVAKKVIYVNRLNALRQFRGVWEGVGDAQCIFRMFGTDRKIVMAFAIVI